PSKTLDCNGPQYAKYTLPPLLEKSRLLVDRLKKLNPGQMGELMGISAKLAQLNWQRYQDFTVPFDLNNSRQALLAFKGDVYSGLAAETFKDKDLEFAQDHVRILSGLYGVLRPLDLMQPYRLEMGTKLKTGRAADLYSFWDTLVTESINRDLENEKHPLLVNLASNEYFKVIHPKILAAPVLNISFKENKNGKYKVIGIHAKRARGLMVNYIVTNRLAKKNDLQGFASEGYEFSADLSSAAEFVFCRG
ncbi:MAG: peroxide stress protein YaaA, partial [Desulfobulbales bacterium]|nr:peroxide stress protein YaaA [Desulfobulbales bacterium]